MATVSRSNKGRAIGKATGVTPSIVDPRYDMPCCAVDSKADQTGTHFTSGKKAMYTKSLESWWLETRGMSGLDRISDDTGYYVVPAAKGKSGKIKQTDIPTASKEVTTAATKFMTATMAERIKLLSTLTDDDKTEITRMTDAAGKSGMLCLKWALMGKTE